MDRQYVEEEQQLPGEHKNRNCGDCDRQHLAKSHSVAPRLEASCYKAKNVKCGETEDSSPQQVVHSAIGQDYLRQ